MKHIKQINTTKNKTKKHNKKQKQKTKTNKPKINIQKTYKTYEMYKCRHKTYTC